MLKLESRVARRRVGVWVWACVTLLFVGERRGVGVHGCGYEKQVPYEQAIRHLAFG